MMGHHSSLTKSFLLVGKPVGLTDGLWNKVGFLGVGLFVFWFVCLFFPGHNMLPLNSDVFTIVKYEYRYNVIVAHNKTHVVYTPIQPSHYWCVPRSGVRIPLFLKHTKQHTTEWLTLYNRMHIDFKGQMSCANVNIAPSIEDQIQWTFIRDLFIYNWLSL